MTGFEEFKTIVDLIEGQGFDPASAARLASLCCDLPVLDDDGRVIVEDNGKVIRLRLPNFDGSCQSTEAPTA